MGAIVFEDNKILFVDNKIAFDCDCDCVATECTACEDDGGTGPAELSLIITGFTDGSCDECAAELNGTFICTFWLGANPCAYRHILDICGISETYYAVTFYHDTFTHLTDLEVELVRSGAQAIRWRTNDIASPIDCDALDVTCPYVAGSFSGCGGHASTTCKVVS